MQTFKAVIVDDEIKLQEVLRIKLEKYCPSIQIQAITSNITEAYAAIVKTKPDIVFLDIAMPGGSGFDLLNLFTSIPFEIIFVTGFDKYALDALKLSAIDYLLKPVDTKELQAAVNKASNSIEARKKIAKYDILKHNLEHAGKQAAKVSIPSSDYHEFVTVADIVRCEGWQKYTRIYLKSGTSIVSSYNIGIFREMLEQYGFYAPHKSHLVNENYIEKYNKTGFITLTDASEIPVSRRKKDEFLNKYTPRFNR